MYSKSKNIGQKKLNLIKEYLIQKFFKSYQIIHLNLKKNILKLGFGRGEHLIEFKKRRSNILEQI